MLNCVFWRHIPLEIEFKSRGSDSNAQRYHPLAVAQLDTEKKKIGTHSVHVGYGVPYPPKLHNCAIIQYFKHCVVIWAMLAS